jgi:hypothetical protein
VSKAGLLALAMLLGVGTHSSGTLGEHAARPTRITVQREIDGGIWGAALRTPSAGSITASGAGVVLSMSCPSAGSCLAGGQVIESSTATDPFILEESNGHWGAAEVLPGISVLDGGGSSGSIDALTCWSVGNCEVIGTYADPDFAGSFVDRETGGVWWTPTSVAGTSSIPANTIGLDSLACTATSCAAGGSYFDADATTPRDQPLVVSQKGSSWSAPIQVPGSLILNDGGNRHLGGSQVNTVSCGSQGNCIAGGFYRESRSPAASRTFLVSEIDGTWGSAFQVPGTASEGAGASTQVQSISCPSKGNCSAGGTAAGQPFIDNESNGTWRLAFEPALLSDADDLGGEITAVSCAADANCSAGGLEVDQSGNSHGFVVDEIAGKWHAAQQVPGTLRGSIYSISCAAPGDCSAGGQFVRATMPRTAGVMANEVDGVWSPAIAVSGMSAASTNGVITAISCGAPGDCGAGGSILGAAGSQPFGVVSAEAQSSPPTATVLSPARGHAKGGFGVVVRGRDLRDVLGVAFGATLTLDVHVLSPTELVAISPPGRGTVDVHVVAQAGTSEPLNLLFTYLAPAIRRLTPSQGCATGGTTVTIYGVDFLSATRVLFGHRTASRIVVIDADAIRVHAPIGSGTVNVRVTTPDGTTRVTRSDQFVYRRTPRYSRAYKR